MKIPHAALAICASLTLLAGPAHADDCIEEIAGVEKELRGGQASEGSKGAEVAKALARAKAAAAEDRDDDCMAALEEARELAGQDGEDDNENDDKG